MYEAYGDYALHVARRATCCVRNNNVEIIGTDYASRLRKAIHFWNRVSRQVDRDATRLGLTETATGRDGMIGSNGASSPFLMSLSHGDVTSRESDDMYRVTIKATRAINPDNNNNSSWKAQYLPEPCSIVARFFSRCIQQPRNRVAASVTLSRLQVVFSSRGRFINSAPTPFRNRHRVLLTQVEMRESDENRRVVLAQRDVERSFWRTRWPGWAVALLRG